MQTALNSGSGGSKRQKQKIEHNKATSNISKYISFVNQQQFFECNK